MCGPWPTTSKLRFGASARSCEQLLSTSKPISTASSISSAGYLAVRERRRRWPRPRESWRPVCKIRPRPKAAWRDLIASWQAVSSLAERSRRLEDFVFGLQERAEPLDWTLDVIGDAIVNRGWGITMASHALGRQMKTVSGGDAVLLPLTERLSLVESYLDHLDDHWDIDAVWLAFDAANVTQTFEIGPLRFFDAGLALSLLDGDDTQGMSRISYHPHSRHRMSTRTSAKTTSCPSKPCRKSVSWHGFKSRANGTTDPFVSSAASRCRPSRQRRRRRHGHCLIRRRDSHRVARSRGSLTGDPRREVDP